jgi:hypothetical protein
MADQWNEELRCPQCHQLGIASLSQGSDDPVPTVDRVADGFKAIQTEYGPNFQCGVCDVLVDP